MDYSYYLKTNIPDDGKLKNYGFQSTGDYYVLQKDLSEADLYALIRIDSDSMDVRVVDRAFDDDYLPFCIKDNQCAVRAEVEALLGDIIAQCFTPVDVVPAITDYMDRTYGSIHEAPWEHLPGYYTFKAPGSQKWYAIIMHLPRSRIGLEGEDPVDIINVKTGPDRINGLIDYRHYFPSYHMNKKSWITVLLDKDTDMDALKALIGDSFQMVEKPRKTEKSWLVPANPKYYDIDRAVKENPGRFIWKQGSSIQTGDIVYLYIAAPVSAIRYKCRVLKTGIPCQYADSNVHMSHVMELRLLKEYHDDPVPFSTLQEHGVRTVRGPRGIPETLLAEIDRHGAE